MPGRVVRGAVIGLLAALAVSCGSSSPEERAASLMCETLSTFQADHEAGRHVDAGETVERLENLGVEAQLDRANMARVERLFTDGCPDTIAYWNDYDADTLQFACGLQATLAEEMPDEFSVSSQCPENSAAAEPTSASQAGTAGCDTRLEAFSVTMWEYVQAVEAGDDERLDQARASWDDTVSDVIRDCERGAAQRLRRAILSVEPHRDALSSTFAELCRAWEGAASYAVREDTKAMCSQHRP